jgi:hypothetical protein
MISLGYSLEIRKHVEKTFEKIAKKDPLMPSAKKGHYFSYAKKPEEKFFSFFKKYAYYYNFKPTWLILFKPNLMKEGEAITKEHQAYLEEQYNNMDLDA